MNLHPTSAVARLLGVVMTTCVFVVSALAQPCTCTNCPQPIPTVSDFQVCYDVQGLTNPTLGVNGQGVCGVSLSFTHDYIENLSLTLISPAGQQVQLLGPGIAGFSNIATAGSRWSVSFVDCGEPTFPYPGTGPTFDGSNTNWQLLGNYTGSYLPYLGCLSSLNTGPANGQWCIRVQSSATVTNGDRLIDFGVEFCDDTGAGCCEAEAPVWVDLPTDTTLCSGDSTLNFELNYSGSGATGYQERIIVTRNDTVFSYEIDSVDLTLASPGTYVVCAIDYWTGDAALLPIVGNPYSQLRTLISTGNICAELSLSCREINIVPVPSLTQVSDQICFGDSVQFNGVWYDTEGVYSFSFPSIGGCDSLVDFELEVFHPDTSRFSSSICQGDTISFNNQTFTSGGNYQINLFTSQGCDSTIFFDVIQYPSYSIARDTAFCAGDTLLIGGQQLVSSSSFRENLLSYHGCDSIVNWNVLALNASAEIIAFDTVLTCLRNAIQLRASTQLFPQGAVFTRTWIDPSGIQSSGATLTATTPGWYKLEHEVSFAGFSCVDIDSIFIFEDVTIAQVIVQDSVTLTCAADTTILSATSSDPGNYQFAWSQGGVFLSADSLLEVFSAGTYTVIGTRLDNGCADTSQVYVDEDFISPPISILSPDSLTCRVDSVVLDGSASTGINTLLQWISAAGVPLQTASGQAIVTEPGLFFLEAIDTLSGCSSIDSIEVQIDTSSVSFNLSTPDTLTCQRQVVAVNVSTIEAVSYSWTNFSGATLSVIDSVLIQEPGSYSVTLTSALSGCSSQAFFNVQADTSGPLVTIQAPDTLRCFPPIAVLDASGSSGSGPLRFEWNSTSTQIITGFVTPRLTTAGGGLYTVVVTNLNNGCSDSSSVTLIEDRPVIVSDAGLDRRIDCTTSAVVLGGPSTSTGPDIIYSWTTQNGRFVGFTDQENVTAVDSGIYILTVRDIVSGCISRDSVSVTKAQGVPSVIVIDTFVLACGNPFASIGSTGSSTGNEFVYSWSTSDGTILAGSDASVVDIDGPGIYRLTITDTISQCVAFAEVFITDDCLLSVTISQPDTITCATGPQISLQASGPTRPGVRANWTTPNGTILSGSNTLSPVIQGGGTYIIGLSEPGFSPVFDSVEVIVDTLAPNALIVGDFLLSCADVSTCVELDGSPSVYRPSVVPSWSTLGGRFCEDTLGLTTRVNSPGLYELLLVDTLNGCVSNALVNVVAEPGVPIPDAGRDRILLCDQVDIFIEGGLPLDTAGLYWYWTNEQGEQIQDTNRTDVRLDTAGIYAFVVVDSLSGCIAADSVSIISQLCAPNARPQASGALSCLNDTITLSTPFQPGMNAFWSGPDGDPNQLPGFEVEVSQPGLYQLIVIDNNTMSSDTAYITLSDNRIKPSAIANALGEITCSVDSVLLDGRLSQDTLGGAVLFQWSTDAGVVIGSGASTVVHSAGSYLLEVTSQRSGCIDSAYVTVLTDTLRPIAVSTASGSFTCNSPTVTLESSGSTGQGSLSYFWQGDNNQSIAGANTSIALISEAGMYFLTVLDDDNGCTSTDTIQIDDLRNTSVFAGQDTLIACTETGVTLASARTVAGGNFQWTGEAGCINDPTSLNPTVSCAGEYVLTYTSDDGFCTYTDTITVDFQTVDLGLEILGDTVITCTNPTVLLEATSSIPVTQFEWSGAISISSTSATRSDTGRVQLIGVDASLCRDTVVSFVRIDTLAPVAVFNSIDTITCRQRQVLVEVRDLNGSSIDAEWTGAGIVGSSAVPAIRVNQPGDFTVQLTNPVNGCSSFAALTVVRDTTSPRVSFILPDGNVLDCNVDELTLDARVEPQNSSIRWNGPAGQQLNQSAFRQNISIGGLYQLTAIHPETGCIESEVEIISDIGRPVTGYTIEVEGQLGCTDESVAIRTSLPSNVLIVWRDSSGVNIDPTEIASTGLFTAFLRDTVSGCRAVDSVRINRYQSPYTIAVSASDTIDCTTTSTTLQLNVLGQLPTTVLFYWISPSGDTIASGTNQQVVVSEPGEWIVSANDALTTCVEQDSIDVAVTAEAIQDVILSVQNATCEGERDGFIEVTAIEGGTQPFEFSLSGSTPQAIGQFGLLTGGQYELIVQDANGCEAIRNIEIEQTQLKSVEINPRYSGTIGDTICITPVIEGASFADSLRWYPANLFVCDTCATGCVLAEAAVNIGVTLWFNGCEVSLTSQIEVKDSEDIVWPNVFSPNGDGINDTWNVEVIRGEVSEIRIYDRWGSIVFSTVATSSQLPISWDGMHLGRPLNPATYVVEVVGIRTSGDKYRIYGDLTLLR